MYINSVGIKIIFKFEYGSCVLLFTFWLYFYIYYLYVYMKHF